MKQKILNVAMIVFVVSTIITFTIFLVTDHVEAEQRKAFESGACYGAEYVWDNGCVRLPSMTAREGAAAEYMARQ